MEFKQRKPTRADWIEYNTGTFFITICTDGRHHFFGHIHAGQMHLSALGKYAEFTLAENNKKCLNVKILSYVVMPNHIHFIAECRGATTARPNLGIVAKPGHNMVAPLRFPLLCGFVGRLKSTVTRFAHEAKLPFAWQRSFHDHMIRNETQLALIDEYIKSNVALWAHDCFYGHEISRQITLVSPNQELEGDS